jgi:hypothetical protein
MKAKAIKSAKRDFGIDESNLAEALGVKTTDERQVSKNKASARREEFDADASTSASRDSNMNVGFLAEALGGSLAAALGMAVDPRRGWCRTQLTITTTISPSSKVEILHNFARTRCGSL